MSLCACNCGKECKPGNKYINGHNSRNRKFSDKTLLKMKERMIGNKYGVGNKCMKGQHHTQESKNKISLANTGKKHSKEHCIKISNSMTGENNPNYGKFGKNHWNWKGGTRKYCPDFYSNDWRSFIYKRDSSCRLCGCTKQLSYHTQGRDLSIHHINHIKTDCDINNCILLCQKCNLRAERKKEKDYIETFLKNLLRG